MQNRRDFLKTAAFAALGSGVVINDVFGGESAPKLFNINTDVREAVVRTYSIQLGKRKFRNSHPSENELKYCPQYLQSLCSGVGIHSEAASIVLRRYRARYPAQRL